MLVGLQEGARVGWWRILLRSSAGCDGCRARLHLLLGCVATLFSILFMEFKWASAVLNDPRGELFRFYQDRMLTYAIICCMYEAEADTIWSVFHENESWEWVMMKCKSYNLMSSLDSSIFGVFSTFWGFTNVAFFSFIQQNNLEGSKGLIWGFMYTNELVFVIKLNYLHAHFADCLPTLFPVTLVANLLCCFGN